MNRMATSLFVTALLSTTLVYAQQTPTTGTTPPDTQTPTPSQTAPAQTAPAPEAQAPNESARAAQTGAAARLAPGSVIPVQLTKTVDAKKAKNGDEVVAKVTQDLKNPAGQLLVPKDTKIVGHVTEAQARNKEQKESELAIAFDKAVMKNGEAMQMPMSIQAIIGMPNQNSPSNDQQSSGSGGGGMPSAPSQGPGKPAAGSSSGTMGGQAPMPSGEAPGGGGGAAQGASPQPQITGETKGVVGISNLTLSPSSPQQGSLVTSEKNNVKLEGGTFMLLRVNQ
jgi:hypothetical protein